MKDLTGRIVGFLFRKLSASAIGNPLGLDGPGGHTGTANRWDEALMASITDESARRILEFWGPRWK